MNTRYQHLVAVHAIRAELDAAERALRARGEHTPGSLAASVASAQRRRRERKRK